jgi:hypothetical protein
MNINFNSARDDDRVPKYIVDLMELTETMSATNLPQDATATVTMTNLQWFYVLDCMTLSRQFLENSIPERLDSDMPEEFMEIAAEMVKKRNQVGEIYPKVFDAISEPIRQQVANAIVKDIKL